MQTIAVTKLMSIDPATINSWVRPPFQRKLVRNARVLRLKGEILAGGGIIPGIITLGELQNTTYLVDGQHRLEMFLESGLAQGSVNAIWLAFDSMAEMGAEFNRLNSNLVTMRVGHRLAGIAPGNPLLEQLMANCPFLAFSYVRTGSSAHVLSVPVALRAWLGSATPTPSKGPRTEAALEMLDAKQVELLSDFLNSCFSAWAPGGVVHPSTYPLWGATNLGLLMWLWRRVGVRRHLAPMPALSRSTAVPPALWGACLTMLNNPVYLEYLKGRNIGKQWSAPIYAQIRGAFAKCLMAHGVRAPKFPSEAWTRS